MNRNTSVVIVFSLLACTLLSVGITGLTAQPTVQKKHETRVSEITPVSALTTVKTTCTPLLVPASCTSNKLLGDADCNGTIDVTDLASYVRLVNGYLAKTNTIHGQPYSEDADFTRDCETGLLDRTVLLATLNGNEPPTPTPSTPSPTSSITPTPSGGPIPTTPPSTAGCERPYTADSPWNTKLVNPTYHPNSDLMMSTLAGKTLSSDPTQYTYPVYYVDSTTPIKTVHVTGYYSEVKNGGSTFTNTSGTISVPIPNDTAALPILPAPGTDAQIIFINKSTGDQWAFWQATKNGTSWTATNGSYYNNTWSGVAPIGYGARGGGIPYFAGLVRKCEIQQGHIDHAIAFAYNYPCSFAQCQAQGYTYYVRPAAKSDGQGVGAHDFPEGAHLQLVATDTEIASWCGSDAACTILARALRDYGMITLDNAGRPKIYVESDLTAHWGGAVTDKTVSPIPFSKFKILNF